MFDSSRYYVVSVKQCKQRENTTFTSWKKNQKVNSPMRISSAKTSIYKIALEKLLILRFCRAIPNQWYCIALYFWGVKIWQLYKSDLLADI